MAAGATMAASRPCQSPWWDSYQGRRRRTHGLRHFMPKPQVCFSNVAMPGSDLRADVRAKALGGVHDKAGAGAPMACIIFMPKPLVCFSNVAMSGSDFSADVRCFSLCCLWRCALSFSAAFCLSLRPNNAFYIPPHDT